MIKFLSTRDKGKETKQNAEQQRDKREKDKKRTSEREEISRLRADGKVIVDNLLRGFFFVIRTIGKSLFLYFLPTR